LGRTYLPLSDTSFQSLQKDEVLQHTEEFFNFIRKNIELYRNWQRQAEEGYKYIPRRYLIPIKTAADMYNWTAEVIYKNPLVVFDRKVKPTKSRIILKILENTLRRE